VSKNTSRRRGQALLGSVLAAIVLAGCQEPGGPASRPAGSQAVPAPLTLLLPSKIRIHSFTGTRAFSRAGGVKGIDVRIQATDAYGDATKAFGQFRFELYRYKPTRADPKGARLAVWTVDVRDPKRNRLHWNNILRTYQFQLLWDQPIPVGQKFVLTACFESPYTPRLFDQHVFTSGE